MATKIHLDQWDSSETIRFFNSTKEKMQTATEIWEKLEEKFQNELKDPSATKKDEILKKNKLDGVNGDSTQEIVASATEEE